MNVALSRLWQEPTVVRNILLHPHVQDVDSVVTNDLLYVLRAGDAIVSYAVVRRGKRFDRLKSLFTFPEHRGGGHAKRLMKIVLEDAHQPLILTCKEHMVGFYERMGFRIAERLPWFLRMRVLFCNRVLAQVWPHRWHAMRYVPPRRNQGASAIPTLRRLSSPRLSSR